jgi:hypothetical protein
MFKYNNSWYTHFDFLLFPFVYLFCLIFFLHLFEMFRYKANVEFFPARRFLTISFGSVSKVEKKFQQIGEFDVILDDTDQVQHSVAGTYKKFVFSVSTRSDTVFFNASSQIERFVYLLFIFLLVCLFLIVCFLFVIYFLSIEILILFFF